MWHCVYLDHSGDYLKMDKRRHLHIIDCCRWIIVKNKLFLFTRERAIKIAKANVKPIKICRKKRQLCHCQARSDRQCVSNESAITRRGMPSIICNSQLCTDIETCTRLHEQRSFWWRRWRQVRLLTAEFTESSGCGKNAQINKWIRLQSRQVRTPRVKAHLLQRRRQISLIHICIFQAYTVYLQVFVTNTLHEHLVEFVGNLWLLPIWSPYAFSSFHSTHISLDDEIAKYTQAMFAIWIGTERNN